MDEINHGRREGRYCVEAVKVRGHPPRNGSSTYSVIRMIDSLRIASRFVEDLFIMGRGNTLITISLQADHDHKVPTFAQLC